MKSLVFSLVALLSLSTPSLSQTVWPKPQKLLEREDVYLIDLENFHFLLTPNSPQECAVVIRAFERYRSLILEGTTTCARPVPKKKTKLLGPILRSASETLSNITISFQSCEEEYPSTSMDERYTIHVGGVEGLTNVSANTAWGVLRAIETISQLVYPVQVEDTDRNGEFKQTLAINGTFILDYPRYSYRGILIDTSRHYIPVDVMKENLDAMSYNKFNVFHWHIVDDHSFPFVSKKFPQLSEKGSYDSETHVYTPEDVQDIINYARDRGIRVLPEFDTPGHSLAWKAQEGLLTTCYNTTTGLPDGTFGPVDPTKEENYHFLYELFSEVNQVFPDSYIHLGGDEVEFDCWKSNPQITKFMETKGIETYEELESFYLNTLINNISNLNMSYLVWQEVIDNGVEIDRESTIVNVWRWYTPEWPIEMENVTEKGYKVVLSAPWYLNYIHYGPDWRAYYDSEPEGFNGTAQQKALIVGGSACMWSEYVDGSGITPRLWPRASAVAERLWSDKRVNSTDEATPRIKRVQCLMQQRGLRVEPIDGPGFCLCDHAFK